jgi:hypothetical protein
MAKAQRMSRTRAALAEIAGELYPMRKRLIATTAAMIIVGALAVSFGQIDWYPKMSTYGVSAGTNNVYCSADLVHWYLLIGCERAS